jgi:hypothetical protein
MILQTNRKSHLEKNIEKIEGIYMEFKNIESLYDFTEKFAGAKSISELEAALVKNSYFSDSPEEAKKPFDQAQWAELLAADPTYQGGDKVGSYTLWLIRTFKTQPDKIAEDGEKAKNYLEIFNTMKNRQEFTSSKRIEDYKSIQDLFKAIEPWFGKSEDELQSADQYKREVDQAEDEIEKQFEDDQWLVVTPLTAEASCKWGAGTQWCTASRNRNYFEDYNSRGPLYICINKTSDSKYQFQKESGSFMDSSDSKIDVDSFIHSIEDKEFLKWLVEIFDGEIGEESVSIDLWGWLTSHIGSSRNSLSPKFVYSVISGEHDGGYSMDNYNHLNPRDVIGKISDYNLNIIVNIIEKNYNQDVRKWDEIIDYEDIKSAITTAYQQAQSDADNVEMYDDIKCQVENISGGVVDGDVILITLGNTDDIKYYKNYAESLIRDNINESHDEGDGVSIEEPYNGWSGTMDREFFNEVLSNELSEITVESQEYKEKQEGQQFLFNEENEPTVNYAKVSSLNNLIEHYKENGPQLPGSPLEDDDFNVDAIPREELAKGLDVEREHTTDNDIAFEIEVGHEKEMQDKGLPLDYYLDHLIPMEEKMDKMARVNDPLFNEYVHIIQNVVTHGNKFKAIKENHSNIYVIYPEEMQEARELARDEDEFKEFEDMLYNIIDVFTPEQLGAKVSDEERYF